MTNRREFLQTGVAVSALPLTMNGLLATQGSVSRMGQSNVTLHKAIFDGRYKRVDASRKRSAGFTFLCMRSKTAMSPSFGASWICSGVDSRRPLRD